MDETQDTVVSTTLSPPSPVLESTLANNIVALEPDVQPPIPLAPASPTVALPSGQTSPIWKGKAVPASLPQGFKLTSALACIGIGLAVRALMPAGVDAQAWTLLSIFTCTVSGLILEPLPIGGWSICCLTALLATKTCSFQTAMSGFTSESIWLIVFSFFFAKAFEKTGLGSRIANMFVAAAGSSTMGMSYSLVAAEMLIAPGMPSCTARAGMLMPVIKFLSQESGSHPKSGRTKMGAFLVHSQMQASSCASALFMTGAAQNLLSMQIAKTMGVAIPDVWITWALGAVVPGLLSILTVPLLVSRFSPPTVQGTPDAPAAAKERLKARGALSRGELITLASLGVAVTMWVGGEHFKVPAVLGAMTALSMLLGTGTLSWDDCLNYTPAWDTLLWFSILVSMCNALSASGLVAQFAQMVGAALAQAKLNWMASFGLLHSAFFWCHYLFASQVGHVGALYGAFLAMMIASGSPPLLAAMSLGYSANLFGGLTHYSSGSAAVYNGSGYMHMKEVLALGALMGVRTMVVWGVVGMAWWKVLGWW